MTRLALLGALALGAAALAHPAAALTMKECSAKYQDAKKAGTLNGQDWKAFRAANCGTEAATPATPAAAATPAVPPAPAAAVAPPAATHAGGSPVFPSAIDPKYKTLKAGTARMKTCDDQYKLNKANGGNAGMKWIEKGGGYYSQCSKHLKAL